MSERKKSGGLNQKNSAKKVVDQTEFICKVCRKKFKEFRLLDRHSLTHGTEQLFPCNGCRKSFYSSQHLMAHRKIHHGDMQFSCDICKKVFTKFGNLKKHMAVHDNGKPYSCDICDMEFRNETTLTRHMRFHTGRKASVVTMANVTPVRKAVRRKSILIQKRSLSIDVVTSADVISTGLSFCPYCDDTFTSIEELDIHRMLCHDNSLPMRSPIRKLIRRSVSLSPITY